MAEEQKNGKATAALILGICAFVFAWLPFVNIILAALAIGLGVAGMKTSKTMTGEPGKGLATAGIVLGVIVGLLSIISFFGMIAYFGVLQPKNFVPDRCQLGAPLACDGQNYLLTTHSPQLTVSVRNVYSKPFTISGMTIRDFDTYEYVDCEGFVGGTIEANGVLNIQCPNIGLESEDIDSQQRADFNILYYENDPTYMKTIHGQIYATVS